MSKFVIVENHYQGAEVVTGVVATTRNTFDSTVSLIENVLADNDINALLQKSGTYTITELILHEVFMIDYSKLDVLGENNYHRNTDARNWTDADIFALDSVKKVYNLAGDDDFMIINLSKAASTHDVRSIFNPLRETLPFREWVNQWFFLKLGFPGESGFFP